MPGPSPTSATFSQGPDADMIKSLFATYRPDIDTSGVQVAKADFPAIQFQIESLEQCMQRIIHISKGVYRIDYFKRLAYAGTQLQVVPQVMLPFDSLEGATELSVEGDGDFAEAGGYYQGDSGRYWPRDVYVALWTDINDNPGETSQAIIYWRGPGGSASSPVILEPGELRRVLCPVAGDVYMRVVMVGGGGPIYGLAFEEIVTHRPLTDAPFSISDEPDYATSFPCEALSYTPDGTGLINAQWVVGSAHALVDSESFTIPVGTVDGTNWLFPLPGVPNQQSGISVTINGGAPITDVGAVTVTGELMKPAAFLNPLVVLHNPPILAFKTPPPAGATVVVTGKYTHALISLARSSTLIAAAGGELFEGIYRDRRITDLATAHAVGTTNLSTYGTSIGHGTMTIRKRELRGKALEPGQRIAITNAKLFANIHDPTHHLVENTLMALVSRITTKLIEDINEPYELEVEFTDRTVVEYPLPEVDDPGEVAP